MILLERLNEIDDNEFYNFEKTIEVEKKASYEQGAREFAEWLTNYAFDHIDYVCYGHFINRQGRQISVDEVLAEWQKGQENE